MIKINLQIEKSGYVFLHKEMTKRLCQFQKRVLCACNKCKRNNNIQINIHAYNSMLCVLEPPKDQIGKGRPVPTD